MSFKDGFEHSAKVDQAKISYFISENAAAGTTRFLECYEKKVVPMEITPGKGRKKLRVLQTLIMKVIFTNADQRNHSKKNELENRVVTGKPMIIALSEIKPKRMAGNSREPITRLMIIRLIPLGVDPETVGKRYDT